MRKLFYYAGFPVRAFMVAIAWPLLILMMPNDKELNTFMKNLFWGRL